MREGDTYAPTPMIELDVPPGAPTVLSWGPALPALEGERHDRGTKRGFSITEQEADQLDH